jgi:hypothetical protein
MAIALVTGSWTATQTANFLGAGTGRPASTEIIYVKDDPGESIVARTGLTLDQSMRHRIAVANVADVIKGSDVNPISGQRVDGLSILAQLTETWKVYDSADAQVAPYYLPVSCHCVWKFPVDALVTAAALKGLTARLMYGMSRDASEDIGDALGTLVTGATRLPVPAA